MRAVRVMQVVLGLEPGGTERLVLDIVRGTSGAVAHTVCCLDERGLWGRELAAEGFTVHELRRQPGFQLSLAAAIRRLSARHEIDVLHCHHYTPFVYGQLAALGSGRTSVVYTEHGRLSDARPSRKRAFVNPLLGRLARRIFAVSKDLREHMLAEGLPAGRVDVIYNGIRMPAAPSSAQRIEARRRLGISETATVVGTVGRLDPVKNFGLLLDAFKVAAEHLPSLQLVLVGDGPSLEELKQRSQGIENVLFAGYRRDVDDLLPAFDVYANSSIHEGVSLTILEAMAAQLPVLATAVGGTPEIVADGLTGLLAPSRDTAKFAEGIVSLVQDRERRGRMGAAARQSVDERFRSERMIGEYEAVYLASSPRGRGES